MSQDDANKSNLPDRGHQGNAPEGKADQPEQVPAGPSPAKDPVSLTERRTTPVVRSAVWVVVIFAILLFAGWAIAYLLRARGSL